MNETLLTAARRVVRFHRIDEAHGGLQSRDTLASIETLDKQVRAEDEREKRATAVRNTTIPEPLP